MGKIRCEFCADDISNKDECGEIRRSSGSSFYHHALKSAVSRNHHNYWQCTEAFEVASLERTLPNGASCTQCDFAGGSIKGHREFQVKNGFRCCDSAKNGAVHVGDEKKHDFKSCDPKKWNGNPNRNSRCAGSGSSGSGNCHERLDGVTPVYEIRGPVIGGDVHNGERPTLYYHNEECYKRASKVHKYLAGEYPEFWKCAECDQPITKDHALVVRRGLRYHYGKRVGLTYCTNKWIRQHCKDHVQEVEKSIKDNGYFDRPEKLWRMYPAGKHPRFNKGQRRRLTGIEERMRKHLLQ